jgi:hypothetical protein
MNRRQFLSTTAVACASLALPTRELFSATPEWIVVNAFRNPTTRGCGLGNIRFMLESRDLGGKCADLTALFVGMARASGLPARDVYGIRVAPSALGYKSLGASTPNISKARTRLFGSWEMNWMAYNFAHDVALPGSKEGPVAFLMYPQAETDAGRLDSLDPDGFKYEITSRELT